MKAIAYCLRSAWKPASFLLIAAVVLCACTPTETPPRPLTPVTVQLVAAHQAQFGGFYAADKKGFYQAEGLDVTFIPGGPKVDKYQPVLEGTAQFGIAGADELLLARSEGKPFKTIAVIFRRSPVVFISMAETKISRPQDLIGKTIRVTPNISPTLRSITAQVGVNPNQYKEVTETANLSSFASGKVPVWGCFLTGLVVEAQQAGHKLNIIYPDDYGVHFYSDALFVRDDFIDRDPGLIKQFLRATFKGWTYAVENTTTIGPMVVKYNPKSDTALEIAKMTSSLMLVNTGEDYIGWMKPEMWAGMEKTLREQRVLTKPLDVSQVYTMQFLKEIYGK
jgi:ABC-type nitrate/sulfonate/bicarbonate transport system substrate-binding protein